MVDQIREKMMVSWELQGIREGEACWLFLSVRK